ncbi:hypothetical protein ENBRE01_1257 [Enteropsectra breve]|nr:hypothetical protein ENBRE01_1257 [Enteropsectra breve]
MCCIPMSVSLENVFKMLADEKGLLQSADIPRALRCAGYVIADESLYTYPVDLSGFIDLAHSKNKLSADIIEACFKRYDADETGYISVDVLKGILSTGEGALSEAEIKDFIESSFPNDEGKICYGLLVSKLSNSKIE